MNVTPCLLRTGFSQSYEERKENKTVRIQQGWREKETGGQFERKEREKFFLFRFIPIPSEINKSLSRVKCLIAAKSCSLWGLSFPSSLSNSRCLYFFLVFLLSLTVSLLPLLTSPFYWSPVPRATKTDCLPSFVSGHETFRSERCNWRTRFLLSTDSESLGKRCSSDMIERKERMMRDGREKKLERKGRMTPTPFFSFLLRFIERKLIWWPLLLILVVIPRRQGTE